MQYVKNQKLLSIASALIVGIGCLLGMVFASPLAEAKTTDPATQAQCQTTEAQTPGTSLYKLCHSAGGVKTPPSSSGGTQKCAKPTFVGLIPWYQYLDISYNAQTGRCEVTNDFKTASGLFSSDSPVLLIGVAIIDDLLRIAGLVAVGFIIYGGVQYLISQGNPDQTNKARQTIINALAGLALAMIAVVVVSFLGNRLG